MKFVVTPVKGKDGKTFWNRVGVMFENDKGDLTIKLNSLPIPQLNNKGEIETSLMIFAERDGMNQDQQRQVNQQANTPDLDDSVPF